MSLHTAILSPDGLYKDLVDCRYLYGVSRVRVTVDRGAARVSVGMTPDSLVALADVGVGSTDVRLPQMPYVQVERLTGISSAIKFDILGPEVAEIPLTSKTGGGAPVTIETLGDPFIGVTARATYAPGWRNQGGQWTLNGTNIPSATALDYVTAAAGDLTYAPTGIPFTPVAIAIRTAPATVPAAPTIGTATPGEGAINLVWTLAATGGSPLTAHEVELDGVSGTNPAGAAATSLTVVAVNGIPVRGRVRAVNSVGPSTWSDWSNLVTPSAASQPIITFQNPAVQGQWVRKNIAQNTVDRDTAGDYYMIGITTNGGTFRIVKRLPNGTFSGPASLASNEPDDHNIPAILQLPSGKWMALWNRHAVSGQTGFRYSITATPHGMDFPATGITVPGTATWNGGQPSSTYMQAYMVGDRVVVFYRVGGSQNGAWVCRYSDNIGAPTPTWSVERYATPTAYMDSALDADGVTLHCAMYDHPWNNGVDHSMWTFDIDLSTGQMRAPNVSTVIGNVFTNTVPVENSAARKAVIITTGTSRLFSIDEQGNLYAMEMEGGNGTTNWPSGTYHRYLRTSSGAYTKQAVCPTGLPFLANQQGYYGSISKLDANRVLCSVNVGASVGVGAWELREYVTSDGGANWTLAEVHQAVSAIIMRPQAINDLMFWYEATLYTDFRTYTARGMVRRSTTAVYTPLPSRPAAADPYPVTLSGTPGPGIAGTAYAFQPTRAGGVGPFTYALQSGSLAGSGLTFDATDGSVDGATPLESTSTITIRVTDTANGKTADLAVTFVIAASGTTPVAPTVTAPTNQAVTEGGTATFTIAVTGTYDTVIWSTQAPGSSTWVDHADVDNNLTVQIASTTLAMSGMKIRARAGNAGSFSADSAEATLTVNASADSFTPVNAATLHALTVPSAGLYRATTAAGSQLGILYTGQKATGAFKVRGGFNDVGASYVIGFSTSTTTNAAANTMDYRLQVGASGAVQYNAPGAQTVVTGFTFPERNPLNVLELERKANGEVWARVFIDGGTTMVSEWRIGTATSTAEVILRFFCSYAAAGTTPRERVIEHPRHIGLVTV